MCFAKCKTGAQLHFTLKSLALLPEGTGCRIPEIPKALCWGQPARGWGHYGRLHSHHFMALTAPARPARRPALSSRQGVAPAGGGPGPRGALRARSAPPSSAFCGEAGGASSRRPRPSAERPAGARPSRHVAGVRRVLLLRPERPRRAPARRARRVYRFRRLEGVPEDGGDGRKPLEGAFRSWSVCCALSGGAAGPAALCCSDRCAAVR